MGLSPCDLCQRGSREGVRGETESWRRRLGWGRGSILSHLTLCWITGGRAKRAGEGQTHGQRLPPPHHDQGAQLNYPRNMKLQRFISAVLGGGKKSGDRGCRRKTDRQRPSGKGIVIGKQHHRLQKTLPLHPQAPSPGLGKEKGGRISQPIRQA